MKQTYSGHELGLALAKQGLLPKECRLVELHLPIDGTIFLRYEVNVTSDDLPKIIRALESLRVPLRRDDGD